MPENLYRKFKIRQQTAEGNLILHPETEVAQIVDFEAGVNSLISGANFPRFGVLVVQQLPTGDDIQTDKIYFVTESGTGTDDADNVYTEYIRVNDHWEVLGRQRTTLPLATTTNVGVVKIGDNINVNAGTISVATATDAVKGVVQVGDNIDVDSGVISVATGSDSVKGVLQAGTNIDVASGVISVKTASASDLGVMQVGDYLNVSNGVVNADVATASAPGVMQVGSYLNVTSGVVAADVATGSAKGVVQGGDRVTITNGVLSADKQIDVIDNSAAQTPAVPSDLNNGTVWFEITGEGTDGQPVEPSEP